MNTERTLLVVLLLEVAIASVINLQLMSQINHLNQSGDTITRALQRAGLA